MFGFLCTFDESRLFASSEVVVVYSDPSFCCHSCCDTLHVTKGTEINNEMQAPRPSFSIVRMSKLEREAGAEWMYDISMVICILTLGCNENQRLLFSTLTYR